MDIYSCSCVYIIMEGTYCKRIEDRYNIDIIAEDKYNILISNAINTKQIYNNYRRRNVDGNGLQLLQ